MIAIPWDLRTGFSNPTHPLSNWRWERQKTWGKTKCMRCGKPTNNGPYMVSTGKFNYNGEMETFEFCSQECENNWMIGIITDPKCSKCELIIKRSVRLTFAIPTIRIYSYTVRRRNYSTKRYYKRVKWRTEGDLWYDTKPLYIADVMCMACNKRVGDEKAIQHRFKVQPVEFPPRFEHVIKGNSHKFACESCQSRILGVVGHTVQDIGFNLEDNTTFIPRGRFLECFRPLEFRCYRCGEETGFTEIRGVGIDKVDRRLREFRVKSEAYRAGRDPYTLWDNSKLRKYKKK